MAQGLSERNNFRLSSFGGGNRGLRRSWIACAGRSGSDAILGWLIRRRHGALALPLMRTPFILSLPPATDKCALRTVPGLSRQYSVKQHPPS